MALVGALVLAGTVPGCGGGGGPSRAAYVQQVERACAEPSIRRAFRTALRELASLPSDPRSRTKALRAAGRSLDEPVQQLTASVQGLPPPEGDRRLIDGWLSDLRKLAVLIGQAAATERRIIALQAHHPGVVERSGTVRNADLDRALEARLAAARTARAYGLNGCAVLLASG